MTIQLILYRICTCNREQKLYLAPQESNKPLLLWAAVTVSRNTKPHQHWALFPSVTNISTCSAQRAAASVPSEDALCLSKSKVNLHIILGRRPSSDVLVFGILIQYFSSGSWQRLDSAYSCNRVTKYWFGSCIRNYYSTNINEHFTVAWFTVAWFLKKELLSALIRWYEIYPNIYQTMWNPIGRIRSEILWIKSPRIK